MSEDGEPSINVYLDDVFEANASDPLIVLRSNAMDAYGGLEQSLCSLMALLLHTSQEKAAIIFFKLVNSSARDHILTQLYSLTIPQEQQPFWHGLPGVSGRAKQGGLLAIVKQMTEQRNQIVHWHVASNIIGNDDGTYSTHLSLFPPANLKSGGSMVAADLQIFIEKASFAARIINIFCAHHSGHPQEHYRTFFEQPAQYPPPADHPMSSDGRRT